jgi:hypothetical protein
MFSIRTMARKVSMNNNYTRKMSYGKNPYKDKIEEIALKFLIVSTPLVVTCVAVIGVTGTSVFMLDSFFNSDMFQSYKDKLDTKDELRRRNKKKDVFHKDKDGVWYIEKD